MKKLLKPKLLIPIVLLLVVGGGVYKFVLSGGGEEKKEPKPKVHGDVYVLPKEFLLNLADDRFAKLSVALILEHGHLALAQAAAGGGGHGAPSAPEGFGDLPQEAVVRDVISDTITDASASELIDRKGRSKIKKEIRHHLEEETDVKVEDVLFTDMAVQ